MRSDWTLTAFLFGLPGMIALTIIVVGWLT
jgi:hypothetical protein